MFARSTLHVFYKGVLISQRHKPQPASGRRTGRHKPGMSARNSANATNSAKLGELTGRQNEYRSELEKCYEEWEQVSMELES